MRTVAWQVNEGNLYLWITDTAIEDREDYYPLLRAWMEEFLRGLAYVLCESVDEAWLEEFAAAYTGPAGWVRGPGETRWVLLGATDLELLREHQANYGLSWISGLFLYALPSPAAMVAQVGLWNGEPRDALEDRASNLLFTLSTYADAECLIVWPGQRSLTDVLQEAEQIAGRLGFTWGNL